MSQLETILSAAAVLAMLGFATLVIAIGWRRDRTHQPTRDSEVDPATLWRPGAGG